MTIAPPGVLNVSVVVGSAGVLEFVKSMVKIEEAVRTPRIEVISYADA